MIRVEINTAALASCRTLPKVELHAHVSGSIPAGLLVIFAENGAVLGAPSITDYELSLLKMKSPPLSPNDCWLMLPLVHRLVPTPDRLKNATEAVLRAFEADNVVYVEIRTAPHHSDAICASQYTPDVLDTFLNWSGKLIARVILSIDRSATIKDATRRPVCPNCSAC